MSTEPPRSPDDEEVSDPWAVRPPTRARGRRLGILLVAAAALLASGVVAASALLVVATGERTEEGTEAPPRAPAPEVWDPQVEPIATFVADARGLDWEHPVPVRFLDEDEFVAEVTSERGDLDEEQAASLEEAQEMLEALSLLEPGTDLFDALNEASATGVRGFYRWDTGEVVMRGREANAANRSTLAHELTHALQDQHFDLGAIQEEAAERGTSGATTTVIEGDAVRIQFEYEEAFASELEVDDRAPEIDQGLPSDPAAAAADVPEIVEVLLSFPYGIGPGFVLAVSESRGDAGVDALFTPDLTEADVLTPIRYLDGRPVASVEAPATPTGAEDVGDPQAFGAIGWYLALAARIDGAEALRAADGWGDDSSRTYRLDGARCVAATYRGDDEAATGRMAVALEEWVAAGPPGAATLDEKGQDVVLHACAADATAGPTLGLLDALRRAAMRNALFAQLLADGAPTGTAWCLSDELVLDAEVAELLTRDELDPAEESVIEERAGDARAICGF